MRFVVVREGKVGKSAGNSLPGVTAPDEHLRYTQLSYRPSISGQGKARQGKRGER